MCGDVEITFFQSWGGRGSGQPLPPDLKANIVAWHQHGVRGHSVRATAEKFRVSAGAVENTLREHHSGADLGGQRRQAGRPRELTTADISKLVKAVRRNPSVTYAQLAAMVDNRVDPSTVRRALKRLDPPVVELTPVDMAPEELTAERQQELQDFVDKQLLRIALNRRVYADESFIHSNIAPPTVKGRRGQKVVRARKRWGQKFTLHVYARQHDILHWELTSKNANDAEIRRVALNSVVPELENGDVLIWDRLGRSGRAKEPKAQHYNPEVKAAVEAAGARILMLPPYGKLLNPVELLFNDLKRHYLQPAYSRKGTGLSFHAVKEIVRRYMDDKAPDNMPGFFKARANGRELRQLLRH